MSKTEQYSSVAEMLYQELAHMTPIQRQHLTITVQGVRDYEGAPMDCGIGDIVYDKEDNELFVELDF